MSDATNGIGVELQRGDGGGPETFTKIAEVLSIDGPGGSNDPIDVTSLDSTAKEFIAGVPDSGEVSIEMLFVGSNAQQQGLEADRIAGTLRNFKLVSNDHATNPTTREFAALVTAFKPNVGGASEAQKASCTLRISGAVAKTYAP